MRKHTNPQPKGPRKYCIPRPQRVRRIEGSFAWIDHRLLRNGYLAVMTHEEHALYLFLTLAADRHGVSFYRKEKICDLLGLDFGQFEVARDRLIDLRLIAFEPYGAASPNGHYQILPVTDQAPDFAAEVLQELGRPVFADNRSASVAKRPCVDAPGGCSAKETVDPVAWARS